MGLEERLRRLRRRRGGQERVPETPAGFPIIPCVERNQYDVPSDDVERYVVLESFRYPAPIHTLSDDDLACMPLDLYGGDRQIALSLSTCREFNTILRGVHDRFGEVGFKLPLVEYSKVFFYDEAFFEEFEGMYPCSDISTSTIRCLDDADEGRIVNGGFPVLADILKSRRRAKEAFVFYPNRGEGFVFDKACGVREIFACANGPDFSFFEFLLQYADLPFTQSEMDELKDRFSGFYEDIRSRRPDELRD